MTERWASGGAVLLCLAAVSCGPSAAQLQLQRERDELSHEVVEVQQYNADLKFRMQLVEARNKVLIDLVQGLTKDPDHVQLPALGQSNADASLQLLDRDIEALVASVRHSHTDLSALRAQRASLQAELTQTRHVIEETRASHAEQDARVASLRKLLQPMLNLIHAGRINVSMTYGQLAIQLPENVLFARADSLLSAEGKVLLAQVAAGLLTASDRHYRVAGPADEGGRRGAAQRQLSTARALTVLEYLVECRVPTASLVAATHIQGQSAAPVAGAERYFEVVLLPKFEELPNLPTPAQLLEEPAAQPPAPPDPPSPSPDAPSE